MAQHEKGVCVLTMGAKGFDVGCDSVHCVPRVAATGLETPRATIANSNVIPFPVRAPAPMECAA